METLEDSKVAHRARRSRLDVVLLATAFALSTMTLGLLIVRAAPISVRLPSTIVANGAPGARPASPYLIFLAELSQVLPDRATVRIVAPREPSGDVAMNFEISVGQLPHQRVLRQDAPTNIGGFVAVYDAPAPADGRLLRRLDGGALYWKGK